MSSGDLWWSERWLDCLVESRELRVKVRKGRVVARRGRVSELAIQAGIATAEVEDESGGFLSVRLRQPPLEDDVWEDVIERLAKEAGHAALLLTGRISENMIDLFYASGAEIFPYDIRDLTYFCTCHDMDAMCIHAAAVHFALGEAMAADPFVLLEFRGRDRAWLVDALKSRNPATEAEAADEETDEGDTTEPAEALDGGYWTAGVVPHLAFRLRTASLEGEEALPVVRALGPGPNETLPDTIADVLAPVARIGQRHIAEIIDQVLEEDLPEDVDPTSASSLDAVLVAAAYQHGALTSALVADALGVSTLEARRYLQWLVEEGRLVQVGKARGTRYVPVEQYDQGSFESV